MYRAAVLLALVLVLAGARPVLAGVGLPRLASLKAGPYAITLHNDSPSLVTGRNTLTVEITGATNDHAIDLTLIGATGQRLIVPLHTVTVLGDGAGHADEVGHGAADLHGDGDGHADTPKNKTSDTHSDERDTHKESRPRDDASHSSSTPAVKADDGHKDPPGAHGRVAVTREESLGHRDEKDDHDKIPVDAHADDESDHGKLPAHAHADESGHAPSILASRATATMTRGVVYVPSSGPWRADITITDPVGQVHSAQVSLTAIDGGPNDAYLAATGSLIGGALLFGVVQRRRGTHLTEISKR
jgi:hypothetical protein